MQGNASVFLPRHSESDDYITFVVRVCVKTWKMRWERS